LSNTAPDFSSAALELSTDAAFISPASDVTCGPADANSGGLPEISSFCVSATSDAERGLSSTRKLPPMGLPYFNNTSTVCVPPLLTGADQ
jgi:hypothetical protein